jgi:hypothetical protein
MTLTFHDPDTTDHSLSTGRVPRPRPPTTGPDSDRSAPEQSAPKRDKPTQRTSRPNLPITPVVAGIVAALGGTAVLIGAAGWADVHPALFIGAALAAVVGGFVARTVRGGGRGLIPVSLLMLTAVTVVAVASPYLDEGTGDKDAHPTTFTDVQAEYSYGIGSMVVDLRDVDFPAGIHHIDVDHGIGSAQVWLPADVSYEITGDTDIGDIDVLGETEDGFNNEVVATSDTTANTTANTTVVIDFNVDIGYGRVGQE